ncbi:hypothetical protein [Spirillospora sp. NPDC047279]|uniref:hypothetical protein n=1 Tax=Spirillospora sp. NPDC047279 TaxID=3155478 RepID=UPI0033CA0813
MSHGGGTDGGGLDGRGTGNDYAGLWKRFAELTGDFEYPHVLRDPLNEPICDLGDLAETLRNVTTDDFAVAARALDVTTEGNRRAELKARVMDRPPEPGDELVPWARRLFHGLPFSVMLNGAERWHEGLARSAAEFFTPAREQFGLPQHNYRISLFIGDYGFTPSGVHQDVGRAERVFHFNAGPGRKLFHSWPVEEYRALTGRRRPSYEPERLVEHARTHELEPGDVMMLNVAWYHVGQSDEPAASVGLEMSKLDAGTVLREAAADAVKGLLNGRADPVRDPAFVPEPVDYADLGWADLPRTELAPWLADAVASHTARTRSNLGFTGTPLPLPDVDEDAVRSGTVRLARPFPLVLRDVPAGPDRPEHTELYARGVRLRVPRGATDLIHELDTGEPVEPGARSGLAVRLATALVRLRGLDLMGDQ